MKKVVLLILLLIPSVYAWNYDTHENLAVLVSSNINVSLNLDKVKEGAIAPDKVFKDTKLHHYPATAEKATYWLDISRSSYLAGNIDDASYAFGVASHYLADSFSDPHYISGELSSQHSKYEDRGYYKIKTHCSLYYNDINNTLKQASKDNYWQEWMAAQDSSIPENKLENAAKLIYSASLMTFNASCKKPSISSFLTGSMLILLLAIILLVFMKKLKLYRK